MANLLQTLKLFGIGLFEMLHYWLLFRIHYSRNKKEKTKSKGDILLDNIEKVNNINISDYHDV